MTVVACACGHVRALHVPDAGCRINGCPCEGFRDTEAAVIPPSEEPRRLVIEIPPGFYVQVVLVPVEAGDGTPSQ